jgi:exopolysaccharide production protein ExoZ
VKLRYAFFRENMRHQNIELLRFIAALAVVYFHAVGALRSGSFSDIESNPFTELGAAGVDLFFVISGFVIFLSATRKSRSPIEFARDRLVRLVPAYWILTVSHLVILAGVAIYRGTEVPFNFSWTIQSLFFVSQPLGNNLPLISQGWSLEIEMLFYLLVAMGLVIKNKVANILFPALALVSLVGFGFLSDLALEFIFGGLLGLLYRRMKFPAPISIAVGVIGIVMFVSPVLIGAVDAPRWVTWGIPSMLVVFSAINLPQLNWKILPTLGAASYPVYLLHMMVINIVSPIVSMFGPSTVLFFFALASCLILSQVLGIFFDKLVDKPISRFLKARIKQAIA